MDQSFVLVLFSLFKGDYVNYSSKSLSLFHWDWCSCSFGVLVFIAFLGLVLAISLGWSSLMNRKNKAAGPDNEGRIRWRRPCPEIRSGEEKWSHHVTSMWVKNDQTGSFWA